MKAFGGDFPRWALTSNAAGTCAGALAALGAAAAATSGALAVYDLIARQPADAFDALAAPAVPLLVAGQLWTIGWGRLYADLTGPARPRWRPPSVRSVLGPLPPWALLLVVVLFCLAWLSGMTALIRQQPTGAAAETDPYARAVEQRAVASLLCAFFVVHTAAALGALRARAIGVAGHLPPEGRAPGS